MFFVYTPYTWPTNRTAKPDSGANTVATVMASRILNNMLICRLHRRNPIRTPTEVIVLTFRCRKVLWAECRVLDISGGQFQNRLTTFFALTTQLSTPWEVCYNVRHSVKRIITRTCAVVRYV